MYLQLMFWSLRHRRWRRLLDVTAMVVTVSVVMVFVSVISGLLAYVNNSTDSERTRILIKAKMMNEDQPMTLLPTLQGIDGVQAVSRFKNVAGRHASGAKYVVMGEEDHGIALTPDLLPVEPAVLEAWKKKKPMGAIVTEETAKQLDLKVGQVTEVPTSKGPFRIEIVGISYGATLNQRIAPHLDYLMTFLGNPGTCRYRVFTKPGDYERVARAVEQLTKTSGTPLKAVNASQVAASAAREAGMVPAVLGFLGLLLIFTTALTLANNTAISIVERRTETATMRVLGYYRRTIVALLLGESVLVGLIGGLVAVIATSVIFRNGIQVTPEEVQILAPVTISRMGLVIGLATSIVLPLVGALPSALAAVRRPLVSALRDGA